MADDGEAKHESKHVPKHVVLVGMMGAGKSTVGRKVAVGLDRPFFDSDSVIEQRVGRSVREIFEQDGEPEFRKLEANVFAELLESTVPSVIAAGGGAVLDEGTRLALSRSAIVVWLRASLELLSTRLIQSREKRAGYKHAGDHRPLLDTADDSPQDVQMVLAKLSAQRSPIYQEVADHVIDVDHKGSRHTVESILEALA